MAGGKKLSADRCYVIDRGHVKFGLWNAIHGTGSSYVCRVRDRLVATVTHANELTEADCAANVISDEIVTDRLDLPAELIAEIQAYCAMIVCMLFLIYTGEKPNRAMYQMGWYYLIGTRDWGSPKRPRFDGSPRRKRGRERFTRLRFGLPHRGGEGLPLPSSRHMQASAAMDGAAQPESSERRPAGP